jgi:ribosome biogenesis GTPase A
VTIQWYPGHMTRAKRMIVEELKIVDAVLELIDARVPLSSRNPDLQSLTTKPRILVLTKKDLADESLTQEWIEYWKSQGELAVAVDLLQGKEVGTINRVIRSQLPEMRRDPRLLVAGIPNVGKSTLINRLTKRRGAKVGARPGVTRGKQWLTAPGMQLLDSPGILWPKFEDQDAARKLAIIASIRDEVVDQADIAIWLLNFLKREYPEKLNERYGSLSEDYPLEDIGRKRGCLLKGGLVDYDQAAVTVLKDFRTGKLGRITLDGSPPQSGVK